MKSKKMEFRSEGKGKDSKILHRTREYFEIKNLWERLKMKQKTPKCIWAIMKVVRTRKRKFLTERASTLKVKQVS